MKVPRFHNPWDTEAEIADATRAALESLGWEVHPETGGWDLLAVARSVDGQGWGDIRPGDLLGVECKLDAGTVAGLESLLRQALWHPVGWWDHRNGPPSHDFYHPAAGPHFRAVVSARLAAEEVWRRNGILTVRAVEEVREHDAGWPWKSRTVGWKRASPETFRRLLSPAWGTAYLPRVEPQELPVVPRVVVDVPAGVPSPQTSSAWKVAAVEVMLRLRDGELLTSEEIRQYGINPRRLIDAGYIADSGQRRGRAYLWTLGETRERWPPAPDLRWPEIATALRKRDSLDSPP